MTDFNATATSAVASLGTGKVQYSIDGLSDWRDTTSNTGSGSMSLDVSALADGTHSLYVRGRDAAGNTGTAQYTYFYLDRTGPSAPTLSVLPTTWTKDDSVSLSWSGIGDLNGLERVQPIRL